MYRLVGQRKMPWYKIAGKVGSACVQVYRSSLTGRVLTFARKLVSSNLYLVKNLLKKNNSSNFLKVWLILQYLSQFFIVCLSRIKCIIILHKTNICHSWLTVLLYIVWLTSVKPMFVRHKFVVDFCKCASPRIQK